MYTPFNLPLITMLVSDIRLSVETAATIQHKEATEYLMAVLAVAAFISSQRQLTGWRVNTQQTRGAASTSLGYPPCLADIGLW